MRVLPSRITQLQTNFVHEHRGKKVLETRSVNTLKRNLKQSFYLIGRENDHIRKLLR
jgi:hypothetical protein